MPESKPAAITKSSPVSVGLTITAGTAVCGALFWLATTTATISTKLLVLPSIQKSVENVARMISDNNGEDKRRDAELKAITDRLDRQDARLNVLEK